MIGTKNISEKQYYFEKTSQLEKDNTFGNNTLGKYIEKIKLKKTTLKKQYIEETMVLGRNTLRRTIICLKNQQVREETTHSDYSTSRMIHWEKNTLGKK